ncbi:MAG: tyrosine-protein phosphatase [Gammaproteobacteria bacterium]|nr:tyrosine-protein phosphatase [Gammaproteobacteria bacterium]
MERDRGRLPHALTEEFSDGRGSPAAHAAADAAPGRADAGGALWPARRAQDSGAALFPLRPSRARGAHRRATQPCRCKPAPISRDMGGYRGADGRRVRCAAVPLRAPAARSERDREVVAALGIRSVLRFPPRRRARDRADAAAALDAHRGLTVDPGSTGSFFQQVAERGAGPADMAAFMEEINREFVRHHAPQFRRMLGELLALEDGGFMINCAAGKDRTGFGGRDYRLAGALPRTRRWAWARGASRAARALYRVGRHSWRQQPRRSPFMATTTP